MHGHARVVLAVICFLAIGCTRDNSARQFVGWEGPYEGSVYPQAVEKWTREGRIYRGLDLELLAHATYKGGEFRDAYVDEFIRIFKTGEAQAKAVRQEEEEAARQMHEFMIAAYVPDRKMDDLDGEKPSWLVFMVQDDGARIQPTRIKRKKIDASVRHFYPYLNPWKSMYSIQFPMADHGNKMASIRLIITGPRGSIELEWSSHASGN